MRQETNAKIIDKIQVVLHLDEPTHVWVNPAGEKENYLHKSTHVSESFNISVQISYVICDVAKIGVWVFQPLLKKSKDACIPEQFSL
jgi:hypothetical protein